MFKSSGKYRVNRVDCRKLWEKEKGLIPYGYEVHHKLPVHAGGQDVIDNLELVTPEEHKQRHLALYHEYGNIIDMIAYHIIGYNFTDAQRITSSAGGKLGGKKVYENKIGIFRSDEERKTWASMGGKIGGIIQRDNKLGIHGLSDQEHLENSSKGGKVGGFTQSDLQRELGRRGGPKNKGFVWLTDGVTTIKYTKRLQEEKSIEQFLLENPNFNRGRK